MKIPRPFSLQALSSVSIDTYIELSICFARYICPMAQIRYNLPFGRFRYDIRLIFSCEAHIESVRTYRARSAYRSP